MAFKILLIADSRGRFLGQELNRAFLGIDHQLIWRGGLTLHGTADFAYNTIRSYKPHMVYILPGICDLTRITCREPRAIGLRTPSVEGTVNNFMLSLDGVYRDIYSMKELIGHDLMIITPTLTGVDIGRYNSYPDELKSPHQKILDNAILNINRSVTALNQSMHIHTPFLATPVHPRCRRRNRFVYDKLLDGLHPTVDLCATWADKLYLNACRNADFYQTYTLINCMY